ncbi:hypothetical protein U9M48_011445 [Paspalum notatum var. saurae]|uniref:Uncharacterized protein n=1 Tax=Paspalum notatum var. saurae TaxID=547442 RepID=A0AAQ3SVE9_PASNO
MHTQPRDSEDLEVLPIVGPHRVARVPQSHMLARMKRVRDIPLKYYSCATMMSYLSDKDVQWNIKTMYPTNKFKRLLVIIDRTIWKILHKSLRQDCNVWNNTGSSSGDWSICLMRHNCCFFKTLTFGSMDPEKHPKVRTTGHGDSQNAECSTNGAYITSYLLRDNFDTHF